MASSSSAECGAADGDSAESPPAATAMSADENDELAYEVEEDEACGRFLVASRDLSQGEHILTEKPTVHGLSRESGLVCFGCYGDLDEEGDDLVVCPACGLPLCSVECREKDQHKPECCAFQSLGHREGRDLSISLLDDIPFLNEIVIVLRCLSLRQTDFCKWLALTELESHIEMREGSELGDRGERVAEWIVTNLGATIEGGAEASTIKQLCGILDVNSFEVTFPGSSGNIQAVYADAGCLVEHNCIPSAHRVFGPDLSLTLRAAVPISRDDHISITYTDSLWPTTERRSHLMVTKYFECICIRCIDPTELKTYISAFKCMKCPVGYVLQTDPINDEDDGDSLEWSCEDCAAAVPAPIISSLGSQVSETLQLMEMSGLTPDNCEKFLTVHLRVLHPQHAHMLDVKHSLLHILGHHEGHLMADLSDRQLQMKEEIGRSILQVADRLLPGISRLRGTTLYELFLTHQQRGLNWSKPESHKSPKDILSVFKTAESHLIQCIDTLQFEPAHQAEGKLAAQAREDLAILSEHIKCLSAV